MYVPLKAAHQPSHRVSSCTQTYSLERHTPFAQERIITTTTPNGNTLALQSLQPPPHLREHLL